MIVRVPRTFRSAGRLIPIYLGIDLPASFYDNLKAIDKNLFPIRHPFVVDWEDFMTQYQGSEEDPRFRIYADHRYGDLELWGYPRKQVNSDRYLEDGNIHIWRLCDVGWAHVIELKSLEHSYLQTVLHRLNYQANYRDRYGDIAWNKKVREDEKIAKDKQDVKNKERMNDLHKENKWLIRNAMDNLNSGHYKATNPEKEIITSYSGQKNHTKITRPITDDEAGLVS